jgi:glycosyltransferase involved in cell wall biosynthesis
MRRILLLLTDLELGGTPTVVRELATRLAAEKDLYVHVACLDRLGPIGIELQSRGVDVTALNARGPTDLSAIHRLHRLISHQKFDTVLSFLIHANVAAAAATLFSHGIRLLQSIQTTQPNPRWHWRLQSIMQHAAEKIIVPSPSAALAAMDWADVRAEKILVIPNAVEPTDFAGIHPPGKNRVGFIGRLDPIKRIGDLIAAMAELPSDYTLHIFGEGAERENLQSLIQKMNLNDRVALHGPIPRASEALATIDVLALPSAAEGFGLVLIEAMAAGIPVVATDVPGIRDVIENGQTGLLVPPADSAALAGAIREILTNADLRGHLIAEGRLRVVEQFSWRQVFPMYHNLLVEEHSA